MAQRVGGLISGMDTDAMVKALTLGQQTKIDNLRKQNTKATWQQTEYRTIITKMNDFKNKYFSNLNPTTNLSSAATLGQYTSKVLTASGASSSAVTATATGSLSNKSHTISVEQLAKKAMIAGSSPTAVKTDDLDSMRDAVTNAGSTGLRFAASYDGVTKAITLQGDYSYGAGGQYSTAEEANTQLAADFEAKLNEAFGTPKDAGGNYVNSKFRVTADTSGNTLSLATAEGGHKFGIGNIAGSANDGVVESMGFKDLSFTTLDLNQKLDKINFGQADVNGKIGFTINGKAFSFDAATTTMQDVFNKVNESDAGVRMYYSELSNSVMMEAKNTGEGSNGITFKDGAEIKEADGTVTTVGGNLMKALFNQANGQLAGGQDAKFTLDGTTTSRSSNSFEVEGVSYTLNAATGNETLNVGFTQDTSKVKDLIVNFVKDYNALIGYINGKTREEKTSFEPLTDEEKAELTEYEIKEWETNAKAGILKNDPLLQQAMRGLSNSIFTSKGETGATAYAFGIMQTGSYSDGGQIKLDMNKLEQALANNPDALQSFFADATNGLAKNMNSVLTSVASTDLINQGTLVQKAGVPGTSSEYFNTISSASRDRNKQIETLLEALTKKQNDLYARYAKMESMLNTMNQQLNSLASL